MCPGTFEGCPLPWVEVVVHGKGRCLVGPPCPSKVSWREREPAAMRSTCILHPSPRRTLAHWSNRCPVVCSLGCTELVGNGPPLPPSNRPSFLGLACVHLSAQPQSTLHGQAIKEESCAFRDSASMVNALFAFKTDIDRYKHKQ